MNIRSPLHPLVTTAALALTLACNLVSPQAQAKPSAAAAPTIEASGIPVQATPIRMTIPEGLATGATAETVDVVTDQTGAAWDVGPAHLQLTLQGYVLPSSFHVPQVFVYPADQYARMNQSAAESRRRLQAVLAKPTVAFGNNALPRVPFYNAAQVFAAQEKVVRFFGGSGVRMVTQYGQDVSPINNGGLFYHFEGLSDDTKYYVIAMLPVNLPFLAADNNPASSVPAGGIPFPPGGAPGSSYEDYFKHTTDLINSASADQFNPPLQTLDALIKSISTQ